MTIEGFYTQFPKVSHVQLWQCHLIGLARDMPMESWTTLADSSPGDETGVSPGVAVVTER